MKKRIKGKYSFYFFACTLFLTSCTSFDAVDPVSAKKYLQSKIFQDFEDKTGMTLFLLFDESTVEVDLYGRSEKLSSKIYRYTIGENIGNGRRKINIVGGEGDWNVSDAGYISWWNDNKLYSFQPIKDKVK